MSFIQNAILKLALLVAFFMFILCFLINLAFGTSTILTCDIGTVKPWAVRSAPPHPRTDSPRPIPASTATSIQTGVYLQLTAFIASHDRTLVHSAIPLTKRVLLKNKLFYYSKFTF